MDKSVKGWVARYLLHRIRKWDVRTSNGVDCFVANSHFISRRINKIYRRESVVIYPPVDVEAFSFREQKEDFYLTAARMVPYKKVDLIVEAFAKMPDKKLIVIGDGPDLKKVKNKAGPNVTFLGHQPFEVLKDHMARAKAFVYAAEEDFGIAVVEALASGTPVVAYGKGGALETVRGLDQSNPTGVFFKAQTVDSLIGGIEGFESRAEDIKPEHCREAVLKFNIGRFREDFTELVETSWEELQQQGAGNGRLPKLEVRAGGIAE